MAQPAAKHPRTDDAVSGVADLQHDKNFWFEDGNIVVVAQQTAFRVHKSVLSRHSETFSGLFAVPQPLSGAEMLDDCPVVRIWDSAYDVRHLLHMLYDGSNFLEPGKRLHFDRLSALARLGHKYELPQVLSASINRLKSVFTSDFAVWSEGFLRPIGTPAKELPIVMTNKSYLEAINLFRTVGHPEMLPVAFYLCATLLPLSKLLRGVYRADGTLETLPVDDLERVLTGKEILARKGRHYARVIYAIEPSSKCRSMEHCEAYMVNKHNWVLSVLDKCNFSHVLRRMFRKSLETAQNSGALCADCVDANIARQLQMQQDIWSRLPEIFNLEIEGWPQATAAAT